MGERSEYRGCGGGGTPVQRGGDRVLPRSIDSLFSQEVGANPIFLKQTASFKTKQKGQKGSATIAKCDGRRMSPLAPNRSANSLGAHDFHQCSGDPLAGSGLSSAQTCREAQILLRGGAPRPFRSIWPVERPNV